MYEMAKKAREAMRGKAKRLAGEKDQKVDSSNWTPAEPLDADVKTGMRPISKQGFKRGGKISGEKAETHAGRKPRKSGGRAITADSLINRNQKEANEEREGKKHIGGLKTGGRAGKSLGGAPTDILKAVRAQTIGFKKGGRPKHATDGKVPARTTDERIKNPNPSPDYQPSKPDPDYKAPGGPSQEDKDALTKKIEGLKKGGRAGRKTGGNVNYGPAENVGGKPGVSTKEQIALENKQDAASKPKRGKAGHYDYGGTVPMQPTGPDGRMAIVDPRKLGQAPAAGSPYKKGGMAKHEDVAEDKALIKKMVKAEARTKKFGGGGLSDLNMGPAKAGGGPAKGKGHTTIAININPKPQDQMGGMPGMPPGMPPRPAGGVPVPMGMPPAGGAPPAGIPMPMPMPAPSAMPQGGAPMARKAGGKVYKSYKDMDAGAGSGLGRLEKTEIQKRKA